MSTRQDYLTAIQQLVAGSDLPLGETEQIVAINKAVKDHSKYNPQVLVQKTTGTAAFDYAVGTVMDYWSDGFSVIKRIEYPVDDTDQDAEFLEDDEWEIFENETGKFLRFLEDEPAITEYFRVHYTALHTCTDSACTIEIFDEEAVQMLAASIFCDMLSTYYVQDSDSTISADSVDHKGKSERYAAKSKVYRSMYFAHLGVSENEVPPVCMTAEWDLEGSWQSDRLSAMWQRAHR